MLVVRVDYDAGRGGICGSVQEARGSAAFTGWLELLTHIDRFSSRHSAAAGTEIPADPDALT